MGSGSQIQFWHDCWCWDQPLKLMFPVLFEIVVNKNASIELLLDRQEGEEELACRIREKF